MSHHIDLAAALVPEGKCVEPIGQVVKSRYGLGPCLPTFADTGRCYGIRRQRVAQLVKILRRYAPEPDRRLIETARSLVALSVDLPDIDATERRQALLPQVAPAACAEAALLFCAHFLSVFAPQKPPLRPTSLGGAIGLDLRQQASDLFAGGAALADVVKAFSHKDLRPDEIAALVSQSS